jgi:hypothetical protein
MSRAWSALCAAILVAAPAYFVLGMMRPGAELGHGVAAFDIYASFYPHVRYALDSLARGDGLLWNPFQDCGQPFFAISMTGLLYPVNWVFAALPREAALLASMLLNLGIAGLGAWWLGREMGLSRPAALAGALAFAYGPTALWLAAWSPIHLAPYVWMPAALAALERLLRAPSPRHGALSASSDLAALARLPPDELHLSGDRPRALGAGHRPSALSWGARRVAGFRHGGAAAPAAVHPAFARWRANPRTVPLQRRVRHRSRPRRGAPNVGQGFILQAC